MATLKIKEKTRTEFLEISNSSVQTVKPSTIFFYLDYFIIIKWCAYTYIHNKFESISISFSASFLSCS